MLYQQPIPESYMSLGSQEIAERVLAHKKDFGNRLVILGHHYLQDGVIQFADFRGDSLKLSQIAAEQKQAEFVVFCGVHFMAESADILTDDSVKVILPDLSAGCSMADMADADQLKEAWDFLTASTNEKIIPVTYVNSTAAIKAFCGEHDGVCCTSSNAASVLAWALKQGEKVIFLPDQHLGRNTAFAMGHPLESMVVYDPEKPDGGLAAEAVDRAKFILWDGCCSVHQLFTVKQCKHVRQSDPDRKIIVHPECCFDVVQQSDLAGSTEFIIKTIENSESKSKWAVGTEANLVGRLAKEHKDKDIRSLANIQCLCTTMYHISPQNLLWSLDEISKGNLANQIKVPAEIAKGATLALQRMLDNV